MLGERLAEARALADMTQEGLARAVGLERTAIGLLERGERHLRVPELVEIAQVLGRPLSFFVEPAVPAVASRRSAPHTAHQSTRLLDAELQQLAFDVRFLVQVGLADVVPRPVDGHVPRTVDEAERAARRFRRDLEDHEGPLPDLARACERFGLYACAASLGQDGPDGGCVEVDTPSGVVGVAVINGDADPGRRRMTLAHELGHWLFGDAYDVDAPWGSEKMIDAFAIHFLAPRPGVMREWIRHPDNDPFGRTLAVAAAFRLSWTAAVGQVRNLGLIGQEDYDRLAERRPRSGDFATRQLAWVPELTPPALSPGFVAAALRGYGDGTLTQARTLELLRGVLGAADLPEATPVTLDDLRSAFEGHGA